MHIGNNIQRYTGINERGENERQGVVRWTPLSKSRSQKTDKSWCKEETRLKRKWLFKEKRFELRVCWCEGRASRGIESVAVTSDGGAEGCRSCLGREFQSTGAWWVKDLSVTLSRQRNALRSDDVRWASCTVRLNIENAVEITMKVSRQNSFVGDR